MVAPVHAPQPASDGREPSFAASAPPAARCETRCAPDFAQILDERIAVILQHLLDDGGPNLGKKRLAAELGIQVRSLEYMLARDVKPSAISLLALMNYLARTGRPQVAASLYGYDSEADVERRVADRLYDKVAGLLAGLNARRPELRAVK